MNYQRIYDNLIEKHGSWLKPKGVYTERHRKLPGYLDGKYVKGNAFYVSARVHYLAHLLWAKITSHQKAWRAVCGMRCRLNVRRSSMYETARALAAIDQSERVKGCKNPMYGKTHTLEAKVKMSRLGFTHSEESRLRMSKSQSNRRHSEETKQKIRDANIGNTFSEKSKQLMSIAKKGKPLSEDHKNKIRLSLLQRYN